MAHRSVYFSFDYNRDLFRVNQVRSMPNILAHSAAGFRDTSVWNNNLSKGDEAIAKIICDGLKNTIATVVCISSTTSRNRYVDFEIEQSIKRGNAIIGLQIHHLRDENGKTDQVGPPPYKLDTGGYKSYKFIDHEALYSLIAETIRNAFP